MRCKVRTIGARESEVWREEVPGAWKASDRGYAGKWLVMTEDVYPEAVSEPVDTIEDAMEVCGRNGYECVAVKLRDDGRADSRCRARLLVPHEDEFFSFEDLLRWYEFEDLWSLALRRSVWTIGTGPWAVTVIPQNVRFGFDENDERLPPVGDVTITRDGCEATVRDVTPADLEPTIAAIADAR